MTDDEPPAGLGPDELAGVVDLFGALARPELAAAVRELAFKRGESPPEAAVGRAVDDAVDAYALVLADPGLVAPSPASDDPLLAVGPAALPAPPDGAGDLPHILDVPERTVDRDGLADAVRTRFTREAARAVDADDRDRIRDLLDACYDLEAWGIDTGPLRRRLDDALDGAPDGGG